MTEHQEQLVAAITAIVRAKMFQNFAWFGLVVFFTVYAVCKVLEAPKRD